jgi:hypothetical protein
MVPSVAPYRSSSRAGAPASFLLSCALVALTWLVTCSSRAGDGESCEVAADCTSGRCVGGSCSGSDCTCEGPDCRGRSSCREGWLCTRGAAVSDQVLPECRQQCTGVGSCPLDKRCENGVCREGPEPFSLTWVNIPRTSPCAAKVPCTYTLRASEGVAVDTYTWSFGDAPAVETKEPTTSFTYDKTGTYPVIVRARAASGGLAELRTTETLCSGGLGAECDALSSLCCEGSCVTGTCK